MFAVGAARDHSRQVCGAGRKALRAVCAIMAPMLKTSLAFMFAVWSTIAQTPAPVSVPVPTDIVAGSINCEECPYPHPSSYLPLTLYGQDVRIAYMDVAPAGTANGHTVVLLHGNNFAGFYFGGPIDALR